MAPGYTIDPSHVGRPQESIMRKLRKLYPVDTPAYDRKVDTGEFIVYENGSGELFVTIKASGLTYRMCSKEGFLHLVVGNPGIKLRRYGGSDGVVIAP
jgi:hypothetical protein